MHRFTRQGVIKAMPHQVFDFVTDQSKLPLWSPEVVSSEVAGGGQIEVGSRLIQKRKQGGRKMTNEVTVTTHVRPRSHAVRTRIMADMVSHVDDKDSVGEVFSRDCAEYTIQMGEKGPKLLVPFWRPPSSPRLSLSTGSALNTFFPCSRQSPRWSQQN